MWRRKRLFAVSGVAVVLALLGPGLPRAFAADLTFTSAADTFVVQDLPTSNFGANSRVEVDHSADRNALLKFTVSGVGSSGVSAATLRLYNVNGSSKGGDFYRVLDNSWQETAVTWDTAPPASGGVIASLGAVTANNWYSVNVASVVTGDGTYSFRIATTVTDGADYSSKEGTTGFAPQLVVTTGSGGGGTGDTTPPTASITSPANGATVSGTITVQASASDNVGVSRVEFLVDGALRSTDTSSPYSFSWDTTGATNASHSLTAKAYDAANNVGTSSTVTVTVSNSAPPPPSGSTVFGAAAGDFGATSNTDKVLGALDKSGSNFFLALGDLKYGDKSSEQAWCDYVRSKLPTLGSSFPFEVVAGNHEEDGQSDGLITNFASCLPDRLGSTGGPNGKYGIEYYFDYPSSSPLVRVIVTAPNLQINGVSYNYSKGDSHYNWVSSAIDGARSRGIPWVVGALHIPVLSAGGGGIADLRNLFVQKRVDLVLEAHEHGYQRGKQLALGTNCTSVPTSSFDADCVVDSGSDGQYAQGAGTIFLVAGTGGKSLSTPSSSSASSQYFARLDGSSFGFAKFTASASRIDYRFVAATGSLSDTFSIIGSSSPPPSNSPPTVTNPGNQTSAEGQAVSLQIQASDPDGNTLSYSASGLPPGLSIGSSTGRITGTVSAGASTNSPYSSSVTASDGSLSDTKSFTWTVTEPNFPPAVTSPGNQSSTEGQVVSLQVTATDGDGDALTYSAAGLPPGLSIGSLTGRITGTVSTGAAANSPYSSSVTASDGLASDTKFFTWTVLDIVAPSTPTAFTIDALTTGLNLDWATNSESDLAGYNVFRSADGVTFTKINGSLVTTSAYLDSSAPTKATSYYRVVAVDRSGNASGPASGSAHRGSIVYVGAASASARSTSLTISKPSGATTGDLLLAAVSVNTGATIAPPNGWTLVQNTTSPGSLMRQMIFSRVVSSGEGSSYTFAIGSRVGVAGVIVAYRGVAGVETSAGQANGASGSITAPAVTASAAESVEVGFFGIGLGTSISPPSGMVERAEASRTSGQSSSRVTVEVADDVVGSGSFGARTATASGAAENVGQAIVLTPTP